MKLLIAVSYLLIKQFYINFNNRVELVVQHIKKNTINLSVDVKLAKSLSSYFKFLTK